MIWGTVVQRYWSIHEHWVVKLQLYNITDQYNGNVDVKLQLQLYSITDQYNGNVVVKLRLQLYSVTNQYNGKVVVKLQLYNVTDQYMEM